MEYPNFHVKGPAACTTVPDREIFFPEPGDPENPRKIKKAKEACAGCPYLAECFAYAVMSEDEQGIWGGTTEYERKKLRRNRRSTLYTN